MDRADVVGEMSWVIWSCFQVAGDGKAVYFEGVDVDVYSSLFYGSFPA